MSQLTFIPTRQLIDDLECYRWIVAGYDVSPEDDPDGSGRHYIEWAMGEYEKELAKRQRAKASPRAPGWPKGVDRSALMAEIKQRLSLKDVIAYEAGATLHGSGNRLRCQCPFLDHKDSTPSFVVYLDQQSYYCYGCQRGGDVFTFALIFWQLDGMAAVVDLLADMAGISRRPKPEVI